MIRADFPELAEEAEPLLRGHDWFVDHGLEEDPGAVHEILSAETDERIERKRVARGCLISPGAAGRPFGRH